jgi:hypothetical protein
MSSFRVREILIAGAALSLFGGIAIADDHLFQAEQPGHGLFDNIHSQGIANADEAPGQGSPFTGAEQSIPATDQDQARHGQQLPDKAGPKK